MSKSLRAILPTLLLLLATIVVIGQQTQQPPPPKTDKSQSGKSTGDELKLAADLIQFDAVVLDKSGKQVKGLKKDDFQVLEDGKPQDMSFFAAENHKSIEISKGLI